MQRAKFMIFAFVFIAVCAGGYLWWQDNFVSGAWRYKLTVTVDTPEGLRSGSAVREVRARLIPKVGDCCSSAVGVIGEAVVVDLGQRGAIFGLIGEDFGYDIMFKAFPYNNGKGGNLTENGISYYASLTDRKTSLLQIGALPRFVTFKNMTDPMSVKQIDINDLAQYFGEGVKIHDVTLETTTDPIVLQIDAYLPWLVGLSGHYIHGENTSRGAPYGLHGGQFQTGVRAN